MIDSTRFPRTAAYLDGLPRGLRSFPGCLAKGSIIRTAFHQRVWQPAYSHAPPELRTLLAHPPLAVAWIPEVHSVAAHHLIADAEGMSDDDVLGWMRDSFNRLASSAMYRAVARLASPSLALRTASLSWGLLHKGLPLTSKIHERQGKRRTAELHVRHPAMLWVELVHRSSAEGFTVVLESSGGTNVRVEVTECDPLGARYRATWDEH